MNVHLIRGIIAFIIWTIFSTWYYVNFIRVSSESQIELVESIPATEMDVELINASDTVKAIQVPEPIQISRDFLFKKNTINLADPSLFVQFKDSMINVLDDRTAQIQITGHACDLGTAVYNLGLSQMRATTLAEQFRSVESLAIETAYKGESEPAVPNTSEANRMKNRRVTIIITSKP